MLSSNTDRGVGNGDCLQSSKVSIDNLGATN